MKLLILGPLALLLSAINAEQGSAFHGPPQARELFSYNDKYFYFYNDRVPYDEATAICEAADMHLTNLDDPGKAKFAAESISEAWMTFEDMWIGARKIDRGHWVWEWTKKRLPDEPQMIGNYTYMYPPWVDNDVPARDGKDCMALDRNGHNDPYFIDLDCKLPRPFICEQNDKQNRNDPFTGGSVEIFDIEFVMYHGRLTWSAAVSFCRQQGFTLASIENMSVAKKLAKAMLKARPEFEDAWIGASLKDDEWVWVENGEEIKTIPGQYKDLDKGEIPENTIVPQFPPWFEAEPRKGRECVIFDRHLCDEPKFIDLKCNRQRDFICMKREREFDNISDIYMVDREKKRYIFFPVAATWEEGRKICEEEGESTTMLNLTDIDETKFIMQAMADSRKPLDHLWLGGKIIEGVWKWVGREESDINAVIPTRIDETGYPPWCDNETNFEMACLNLDRQNHWTPLIYGLECNSTQAVVCVQPIEPNDRIVEYVGSGIQDQSIALRITKLDQNPLSWLEADTACRKEVGKLWKPRFDLPESQEAFNKFFEKLKKGEKQEKGVYYLDGGRYDINQKTWLSNKKAVNITTGWPPRDGDCLVVQINTTQAWTFFPVKCYHKLYAQVICEPKCSLKEVPYEETPSEWMCDAASSNIFDHKMLGMGCNHHCFDKKVMLGPERYYCGKQGWFNNQANIPVKYSLCKDLTKGLDAFKDITNAITTLAFVIDSTSDSPADYNAAKYLLGNLIDYYRAHLKNITVSVISIEMDSETSEEAIIKVKGVPPTEDCAFINKTILDLLVDTGEGIRNFAAGLLKVKEAFGDTPLGETNVVFLTPEANQRSLFKERAKEINEDALVYAIGTNRHAPMTQLVDIASQINERSFAIQFRKPPDVIVAVRALMKDCHECKCSTAFDYLVSTLDKEYQGSNNANNTSTTEKTKSKG